VRRIASLPPVRPSSSSSSSKGSFEANPPFVPEVMAAMLCHMDALLKRAKAAAKALSFVVVVPHWPAVAAWQALQSSAFQQPNGFHLAAANHGFVDGYTRKGVALQTHEPSL
jgi:phosphohistidine phosphatase SixA